MSFDKVVIEATSSPDMSTGMPSTASQGPGAQTVSGRAQDFREGDFVEVRWGQAWQWYNATVKQANPDSTYNIVWDSTGCEHLCTPQEMRLRKGSITVDRLTVGQRL